MSFHVQKISSINSNYGHQVGVVFPFGLLAISYPKEKMGMSISLYAKKFEEHCRNVPQLNEMACSNISYFYSMQH